MAESATSALAQGEQLDPAPKARSLAEELAATRAKLAEDRKPKLFELPGYGPKLQVKYKVIDYDTVSGIGDKIAEQIRAEQIDDGQLMALCDTLIQSCVGLFTDRDGEVIPLEEAEAGYEGGPIRWGDERLARFVGLEAAEGQTLRARAILRGVITDDMLVLEHAQDVTLWMEQARRQVNKDF